MATNTANNAYKAPVRNAKRLTYRRIQFRTYKSLQGGCYLCSVKNPGEGFWKSTVYDIYESKYEDTKRCFGCKAKLQTKLTPAQREATYTALSLLGVNSENVKKFEVVETGSTEARVRLPLSPITKQNRTRPVRPPRKRDKEDKNKILARQTLGKENKPPVHKIETIVSNDESPLDLRVHREIATTREVSPPPIMQSDYVDEDIERMILESMADWPVDTDVEDIIRILEDDEEKDIDTVLESKEMVQTLENSAVKAKENAQYEKEEHRLKSFESWPHGHISSRELAKIGFYFTGEGDTVKCFACSLELRGWQERDRPIEEHCVYRPTCTMVLGTNCDNEPIEGEDTCERYQN